ncbi:MAG: SMP-30/gluconolactonase/LRE family protein [Candidatus Nanopelagicales bacterium]
MQQFLSIGSALGEGPTWEESSGTWLFVDITAAVVHRLGSDGRLLHSFEPGSEVSAVLPTSCGRLLLVGFDRLYVCEADGTDVRVFGDQLEADALVRMNDAKVDSRGRLWTGSRDKERAGRARLYRVDANGAATVMLEGVNVSNGLGWSPDDRSFYYIDSLTYSVRVFDFDSELGELGESREFCTFDPDTGLPDGLSVDEHGHVWVAHFGSGSVTRHAPSGDQVAVHHLPVPNVTSLAFGGTDGTDVIVTTARYRMSDDELGQYPMAGDVFWGNWGIRGLPTHAFIVG